MGYTFHNCFGHNGRMGLAAIVPTSRRSHRFMPCKANLRQPYATPGNPRQEFGKKFIFSQNIQGALCKIRVLIGK
jgi:hypothetical protein